MNKLKLRDPFFRTRGTIYERIARGKCKILAGDAGCNYSASLHTERLSSLAGEFRIAYILAFREILSNLAREFVRWEQERKDDKENKIECFQSTRETPSGEKAYGDFIRKRFERI